MLRAYGNQYLAEARHFSLQKDEKTHYLDEIGGSTYVNELSFEAGRQQVPLRVSYAYSLNKKQFDPESQVMVRLISNKPLPHDIKTGKPKAKRDTFGKSFRCCGGIF